MKKMRVMVLLLSILTVGLLFAEDAPSCTIYVSGNGAQKVSVKVSAQEQTGDGPVKITVINQGSETITIQGVTVVGYTESTLRNGSKKQNGTSKTYDIYQLMVTGNTGNISGNSRATITTPHVGFLVTEVNIEACLY
ncbi:MAG: hypothetical protein LBC76_04360 [Treponema sp.]|jgi:hypothetical protein|nr:hypothetical protein [Treponema sp.]